MIFRVYFFSLILKLYWATTDDPAVPYGELVRLSAALPHARTITVESFQHVDFDVTSPSQWLGAVRDLGRTWRFTRIVLEAR